MRRVETKHTHVARVARAVPLEDLGRRRLSRSVGPKQAEDLTHADREAHTTKRLELAVRLTKIGDLDRIHATETLLVPQSRTQRFIARHQPDEVVADSRAFEVVLTPEEEGGYSVSVPGLPGCFSQGETREEALAMIREAIERVTVNV